MSRFGIDMADTKTFLEEYEINQRAQDRRPMTEKADPLALSWVSYHVWQKFPNRRWTPWDDLEASNHDRDMAQETRRYYRNKLAMRALRSDREPSQFSQDLYDICNGGIMRECHRGMIYRLPYFYVEDTKRAELIADTQSQPNVAVFRSLPETRTVTLLRHSCIFHSRRNRETMEYWFHDADTNQAVLWSVSYDNPCRSLVEQIWRDHTCIKLYGRYLLGHDTTNDFHFWKVLQPELRFDH